ncbi:E3 ubiquitin-protein ligase COP1 [Silene latifolia]|uniref:E3 ubiquitin-protein ligase COP1 n=1 Tax=Silene latifolia TaxID=37657 RepID=UPI003D781A00
MEESSNGGGGGGGGALVPLVKSSSLDTAVKPISVAQPPLLDHATAEDTAAEDTTTAEMDKDLMCPICMQMIKDAFLTACGHSFCYMCIITHLRNKNDCPCCSRHLTNNQLYPNFLLDKLLKKASAQQVSKFASPMEQFRRALQQGCEVSVKEVDNLLSLLAEKKKKMEQEEAERNMQILLDFLHCLRKQKVEELSEIQADLQFIKEDISAVERHRMELYRARDRYSVKLRMLGDDPTQKWPSTADKCGGGFSSGSRSSLGGLAAGSFHNKKMDGKAQLNSHGPSRKDALSGLDSQYISQSGLAVMRKKRIHTQFNDLQECYLQKRRQLANQSFKQDERDTNFMQREGYSAGLAEFQSVLSTFTRYSRLRVIAELRHGDPFHSANIVSSIEFDRDDELFATAGVSRRIKVFDFSSVVNEPADAHCPVVEMSTLSKLSCLSWNKFTKNQIASSDYEGIVTVWDVTTRQRVMEYEEHEKRAWSVDFSSMEPTMLVSGSDDCKVKVWCTRQEASVLNIDMKANICCVKYNPGSSYHVAVGSADHDIHYYDLRNVSQPLHVFCGHKKAVSYVKFLSTTELASASTDSTLRLWDVKNSLPVRTFRGHTNEKNFVGLTVNSEYIGCGSETNEVFVYHKEISRPVTWHKFGSQDTEDADEDAGSYFISAVCWKSGSPTLLTANSQGTIKVLVLAA